MQIVLFCCVKEAAAESSEEPHIDPAGVHAVEYMLQVCVQNLHTFALVLTDGIIGELKASKYNLESQIRDYSVYKP